MRSQQNQLAETGLDGEGNARATQISQSSDLTWCKISAGISGPSLIGGTNPRVVQEQLGHADLRMLQRYAHVVPEDQRSAVERATAMFLRRSAANTQGKSLQIN